MSISGDGREKNGDTFYELQKGRCQKVGRENKGRGWRGMGILLKNCNRVGQFNKFKVYRYTSKG